ncbi:MAG: shikimate dehydrogenase [Pseudonocardiales bacterium]
MGLRAVVTPVRRAAVLGRPIAHSLSPLLHRAAYAALGLDWQYEAIGCGVDELATVLAERDGWAGFSCTMPLKHAALAVADEASPVATLVGAANTLLPRSAGGWVADNTDVTGIVAALAGVPAPQGGVAVLGAGGTAQAAVVALAQSGVTACAVLVRDVSRAAAVVATAAACGVRVDVGGLSPDAVQLGAGLVVSTLPPGAADALAARVWSPEQTLFDVVYDPWPSVLAGAVQVSGGTVISGAQLLLQQAAAQVELMTGQLAPVEAMRAALRAAAPNCCV